MDQIWLLGDSLTQGGYEVENNGFAARLAHAYNRKLDVINRGLAGYNTTWAIPVFEQEWPLASSESSHPKIQLLAIWFGANDAALDLRTQHVPIPEFKANLTKIINTVREPSSKHHSPSTRIVLVTPPPVNTHQRHADLSTRTPPQEVDRGFEQTKSYAAAVRDLGASLSVPVADVWTALWKAADEDEPKLEKYLSDGLHLTAPGYDIVYATLLETVVARYPELDPSRMRYVYVPWSDIDPKDPAKALSPRVPFAST